MWMYQIKSLLKSLSKYTSLIAVSIVCIENEVLDIIGNIYGNNSKELYKKFKSVDYWLKHSKFVLIFQYVVTFSSNEFPSNIHFL